MRGYFIVMNDSLIFIPKHKLVYEHELAVARILVNHYGEQVSFIEETSRPTPDIY